MTTTFYSTKRNANVSIANSKVCGYRISNNIMKKGYSDGVRAGPDNGVVNQGLSRFSTESQREDAGSSCAGNVNWINYRRGENFNPPESAKNQFNIDRGGFKAGAIYEEKRTAQSISGINHRIGQGNREIIRPAFMSPAVHARLPVDFDKLQAMDIADFGQKVQLGQEQLEQLAMVAIPDPQDTQWLDEQRRLVVGFRAQGMADMQIAEELDANMPLGREQRTIKKNSKDIARDNDATIKQKLQYIYNKVNTGRAESRLQQATLTGELAVILNDTNAIATISRDQLSNLGVSLARMGVPTTAKALGIMQRFVDLVFYNANAGMVNLLLYSKVREGENNLYNYDKLVKNYASDPDHGLPIQGLPPDRQGALKLTSAITALGRQGAERRYLDLERGGVISRDQLDVFAQDDPLGGYDGANFSIDNPPNAEGVWPI